MITTVACVAALAQYVGVLPYKIYLGTHRPIGLYSEPDWLGMFSAVGCCSRSAPQTWVGGALRWCSCTSSCSCWPPPVPPGSRS